MVGSLNVRQVTILALGVVGLLLSVAIVPSLIGDAAAQQTQPETDNTVTRIEVHENGSARWTIQIRTRLDTADRVDDYEAFRARFAANESRFLDSFRARMQRVVTNGANATGREMRAVEFTASTSIQEVPRRWGIVTYQFTWTNFAALTDGTLVVGDVFQGGFFLAANDTLVIAAPDGYEIDRVEPTPTSRDAGIVSWFGRKDFPHRQPLVEFVPQAGGGPIAGRPTTSAVQPSASPTEGMGPSAWLGVALLVLLVSAIAYGVYRRGNGRSPINQRTSSEDEKSDDAATEVVMTEEERVRGLLEDRGGRTRQAVIADELGWSASKTSRVVGRMVAEGAIEKLQLGRENLLNLVDEEE